ncbi:MAG: PspC domain-containing protein [Gemmatimonadaceae bacterium]
MADTNGRLRRSRSSRMIAGVVGGLAEYFGFDPTIMRVIYVVLSIISVAFPGLLVYVILWVVLPDADDDVTSSSGAA